MCGFKPFFPNCVHEEGESHFDNLFDDFFSHAPVGFNANARGLSTILSFRFSHKITVGNRLHAKCMHHRANMNPFQLCECVDQMWIFSFSCHLPILEPNVFSAAPNYGRLIDVNIDWWPWLVWKNFNSEEFLPLTRSKNGNKNANYGSLLCL